MSSAAIPTAELRECKRRRAITNAQRRALRAWFFDSDTPKSQSDASLWWQETYGYYLNSSTVSEILSYKYNPLDAEGAPSPSEAPSLVDERKRHRPAKWEELEEELVRWVFWHELVAGEGSVTGNMLRHKGTELWYSMPCYQNMPLPKWSEGWRSRFRARYNLRKYSLLWEAAGMSESQSDSSDDGVSSASGASSASWAMSD
jgi:hypothetical protein